MVRTTPKLLLVTSSFMPEPDADERPLLDAFAHRGVSAALAAWDDPEVDWAGADLVVIRSSWSYFLAPDRYAAWLRATSSVTRLLNPAGAVAGNLHKGYMLALEAAGVPVVPTVLLPRGDTRALLDLLEERGWEECVVKPAVSAGSYRTFRHGRGDVAAGEAQLRGLVASCDTLVQEYLPSVAGYGERSLIFIDGQLSHVMRKSPRFAGDVESVSGPFEATPDELAVAEAALALVDADLLYARVDQAPDRDGRPVLMELEINEPSLFLTAHPPALRRFVQAVIDRLPAAGPAS